MSYLALNDNPYPLVEVAWRDACGGDSSWIPLREVLDTEPPICYTVGYLVKRNADTITVVSTFGMNDGEINDPATSRVGSYMVIPSGFLISVSELQRSDLDPSTSGLSYTHEGTHPVCPDNCPASASTPGGYSRDSVGHPVRTSPSLPYTNAGDASR